MPYSRSVPPKYIHPKTWEKAWDWLEKQMLVADAPEKVDPARANWDNLLADMKKEIGEDEWNRRGILAIRELGRNYPINGAKGLKLIKAQFKGFLPVKKQGKRRSYKDILAAVKPAIGTAYDDAVRLINRKPIGKRYTLARGIERAIAALRVEGADIVDWQSVLANYLTNYEDEDGIWEALRETANINISMEARGEERDVEAEVEDVAQRRRDDYLTDASALQDLLTVSTMGAAGRPMGREAPKMSSIDPETAIKWLIGLIPPERYKSETADKLIQWLYGMGLADHLPESPDEAEFGPAVRIQGMLSLAKANKWIAREGTQPNIKAVPLVHRKDVDAEYKRAGFDHTPSYSELFQLIEGNAVPLTYAKETEDPLALVYEVVEKDFGRVMLPKEWKGDEFLMDHMDEAEETVNANPDELAGLWTKWKRDQADELADRARKEREDAEKKRRSEVRALVASIDKAVQERDVARAESLLTDMKEVEQDLGEIARQTAKLGELHAVLEREAQQLAARRELMEQMSAADREITVRAEDLIAKTIAPQFEEKAMAVIEKMRAQIEADRAEAKKEADTRDREIRDLLVALRKRTESTPPEIPKGRGTYGPRPPEDGIVRVRTEERQINVRMAPAEPFPVVRTEEPTQCPCGKEFFPFAEFVREAFRACINFPQDKHWWDTCESCRRDPKRSYPSWVEESPSLSDYVRYALGPNPVTHVGALKAVGIPEEFIINALSGGKDPDENVSGQGAIHISAARDRVVVDQATIIAAIRETLTMPRTYEELRLAVCRMLALEPYDPRQPGYLDIWTFSAALSVMMRPGGTIHKRGDLYETIREGPEREERAPFLPEPMQPGATVAQLQNRITIALASGDLAYQQLYDAMVSELGQTNVVNFEKALTALIDAGAITVKDGTYSLRFGGR